MPKFSCRCGFVINLSEGWSDYELALIPESRIEKIGDLLESLKLLEPDHFYGLIDEVKKTAYLCPSCGRIYIDDGSGKLDSFVKEIDGNG